MVVADLLACAVFYVAGFIVWWYVALLLVLLFVFFFFFFFSSRRRHTRCLSDWSSDVCSSDLALMLGGTYALLGIGLTLIFGIMRVVNFTHGELYAFGAYMMYVLVMLVEIGRASCRERV